MQRLIVGMNREGVIEFVNRHTPPTHDANVHRTWVDVIVNRSSGRCPALIGHAGKPEYVADRFTTAAWKRSAISKICSHAT